MGYCLSAVNAYQRAMAVGVGCHLGDGVDGAEHVRHMAYRHEACALGEETAVYIEVEAAVGVYGHYLYHYARAALEELPRHDVGVVLHDGEDYLVARFEQ